MTRDPTTTSYLPTLDLVDADLHTVIASIHAYRVACHRREWNGADVAKKQQSAVHTIKSRVSQAYNRLDLGPTERERLVKELRDSRDEANALRFTNARLREQLTQLTAANVRLLEGKAA